MEWDTLEIDRKQIVNNLKAEIPSDSIYKPTQE